MQATYNYYLVALSYAIAAYAAYSTLLISSKLINSTFKIKWLVAGSTTLGYRDYLLQQIYKVTEAEDPEELTTVVNLSFDKLRSIGNTIGQDFVSKFLKLYAEKTHKNIPEIEVISRISTTSIGFLIPHMIKH